MTEGFYEHPGDVKDRIDDAYRPTESEVREAAVTTLVEGVAAENAADGQEIPGIRAPVEWAADAYEGTFDSEEFYEVVTAAVAEVLDDLSADDLDEAAHMTLDEFVADHVLKFVEEGAEELLAGRRDTTVRYDDEKRIQPGDVLELRLPDGRTFGRARVAEAQRARIDKALRLIERLDGAYRIESTDDLLRVLNEHYETDLEPGHRVKVLVLADVEAIAWP